MYQGKSAGNIDIHKDARNLPTTQKAVANAILKSKIDNDTDGVCYIFMDNQYGAPQLFAMMTTEWNICAVGTCTAKRKGFPSDKLKLPQNVERGSFV